MNHWTKLSIDFANQRNYLDERFAVVRFSISILIEDFEPMLAPPSKPNQF